MRRCNSCGAPVRWVVMTRSKKRCPLDAEPHPEGTFVVYLDGRQHYARPEEPLLDATGPRYRSHFSTCPNAGEHSKKTAGKDSKLWAEQRRLEQLNREAGDDA